MTIDAHQHFWKYLRERDTWITDEMGALKWDFQPEDLHPLLTKNKIEGCVVVQVDQSEKETENLIKLAQSHSFIKGVVGWTDLSSTSVQVRLEHYHQFSEVKGFRHIVQSEPDGFLLRKAYCRGIDLLHQYDFTYDILIYPQHLPEALTFIKKFPHQKFVIDHLAKPLIREHKIKPWKQQLQQIAMHENVYCKLSGMVTEADWKNWKATDFTPYMETVMESFGPKRVMYGSDWPVCLLAANYHQQFDIVRAFIESFSPLEKKAILGENAVRFYHL
ncbi:MAG TPA: amidohydrolase family protein [Cyclobacteriaceae bacterium]|nr:amidohydrolase family protein [Cyclobacteriaceae bacterium]